MKFFFSFCFWAPLSILVAQCPYNIGIDVLNWEGQTITLKWHCQPKPLAGEFDIFRTCLSTKNDKEKHVSRIIATKPYEYSDADLALNANQIYAYRVQLRNMPTCVATKRTKGRVIEEDTLNLTSLSAQDLKTFSQKEVVTIKTKKDSTKSNVFFPIEISIKDFNFPFTSHIRYALVCEGKVIETVAHVIDDDFRFAEVYILEHPFFRSSINRKEFRIAMIEGHVILGMSGLIECLY